MKLSQIAEQIEELGLNCHWCETPIVADSVKSYDHPNGVDIDDFDTKQWVYFTCTEKTCGYDWSLVKLQMQAEREGKRKEA
ncbi:hypothetical protein LCGC14_2077320 [marine sediment metagenome]|uniref:Uncharacterized protein n=1 Tax=marine sediment metagenome TaxID=412755 RepID=A0A0F9F3Z5_9ZZZZ